MNEKSFREWLGQRYSRKVVSDNISRLKRIIREITDVDAEYDKDRCHYLLSLFDNLGDNAEMKSYNTNLPVGSSSIRCYKYALTRYIKFREESEGKRKIIPRLPNNLTLVYNKDQAILYSGSESLR